MGILTEISSGILTRMQATLGSDYKRLSFVNDISKNTFKGNHKRYGIKVGGASETSGQVGAYTLDHTFYLYLVDSYASPTNQLNDDLQAALPISLGNLAHTIFKDLAANKSTFSSKGEVLIINNFNISEIEYLESQDVGVLEFSINVKYKQ